MQVGGSGQQGSFVGELLRFEPKLCKVSRD